MAPSLQHRQRDDVPRAREPTRLELAGDLTDDLPATRLRGFVECAGKSLLDRVVAMAPMVEVRSFMSGRWPRATKAIAPGRSSFAKCGRGYRAPACERGVGSIPSRIIVR
jgi:hypothetical protein